MAKRKQKKTRVVIQVEPSFQSELYLRGEGLADLSWEKGIELKHVQPDEWVFETEELFSAGSFKVLIDDKTYELGENHPLYPGASIRVNPKFPNTD
jgi:hypothetical protein